MLFSRWEGILHGLGAPILTVLSDVCGAAAPRVSFPFLPLLHGPPEKAARIAGGEVDGGILMITHREILRSDGQRQHETSTVEDT